LPKVPAMVAEKRIAKKHNPAARVNPSKFRRDCRNILYPNKRGNCRGAVRRPCRRRTVCCIF